MYGIAKNKKPIQQVNNPVRITKTKTPMCRTNIMIPYKIKWSRFSLKSFKKSQTAQPQTFGAPYDQTDFKGPGH